MRSYCGRCRIYHSRFDAQSDHQDTCLDSEGRFADDIDSDLKQQVIPDYQADKKTLTSDFVGQTPTFCHTTPSLHCTAN